MILVTSGIFLCFFGLTGFAVVIYFSFKARKETKAGRKDKTKNIFKQLIVVNSLSLCLSAFGLLILVLGVLFR